MKKNGVNLESTGNTEERRARCYLRLCKSSYILILKRGRLLENKYLYFFIAKSIVQCVQSCRSTNVENSSREASLISDKYERTRYAEIPNVTCESSCLLVRI